MAKRKNVIAALLLAAIVLCGVWVSGFIGVSAADKTIEDLLRPANGATVTQTENGVEVNAALAWHNAVEVSSFIDIYNFEVVVADDLQGCLDVRVYDSVADELRFFIRLNADPGDGNRNNVGIFRDTGSHHYGWIPTTTFVEGKCSLVCKDGVLYINGTDMSQYTGETSMIEFLTNHPSNPIAPITNELGRINLSYESTGKSTLLRFNGTSLAKGSKDTSVPFFRMTAPAAAAAAGTNVNIAYTAYDLLDEQPAVSVEYRLAADTEGEWAETAITHSETASYFQAPQMEGAYTFRLKAVDADGNVGYSDEFAIEVTAPIETGIAIASLPTKTVYKVGDAFDAAGLVVNVLYEGGASAALDASEYALSGFDSSTAGEKTVTVTYGNFTATFKVQVEEPVVTEISINVNPTKTKYVLGEDLDLTGMVVKATYDTGKTETITDYTVSGYDNTKLGEQTITVTYAEKTAFFKVNVTNDATGIEITAKPTKLSYEIGEDLDLSGLKVSAVLENGSKEELASAEYTVSGFDGSKAGEQTVTVTYEDFTAQFTVTVVEAADGCSSEVSVAAGVCAVVLLSAVCAALILLHRKTRVR